MAQESRPGNAFGPPKRRSQEWRLWPHVHVCHRVHTGSKRRACVPAHLCADINANRGISAWAEDGGAGGAEGGNSYEDLCRAHIEAMVNAAAAQEVQSELTQRVSG